ncbi:MAG: LPS export ABC transporter periplasmic protein LptC [Helicobacteraceae bacterium]|nr:LPS export ABC transporter periplasmic protein LptC [Helicobacteraceae bacterium]
MKIWIAVLALLTLSLIASFFLSPENREGGELKTTARLEFSNYQIYAIDKESVSAVLTAQSGRVFDDREELDYPIALRQIGEARDGLSGVLGVIKGDEAFITNEVYYWDSFGRTLKTQAAKYNVKSKIITGDGAFTTTSSEGVMNGVGFVADVVKKTFRANEIKAVFNDKNL